MAAQAATDGTWVVYKPYQAQDLQMPGTYYAWNATTPTAAPVALGTTARGDDTGIAVVKGRAAFFTRTSATSGRLVLHQVDLATRHAMVTDAGSAGTTIDAGPSMLPRGVSWSARTSRDTVQLHAVAFSGSAQEVPWMGGFRWASYVGTWMASVDQRGDLWLQTSEGGHMLVDAASMPGRFSSAQFDGRHLAVVWTKPDGTWTTRLYDDVSDASASVGDSSIRLDNGWLLDWPRQQAVRADLATC